MPSADLGDISPLFFSIGPDSIGLFLQMFAFLVAHPQFPFPFTLPLLLISVQNSEESLFNTHLESKNQELSNDLACDRMWCPSHADKIEARMVCRLDDWDNVHQYDWLLYFSNLHRKGKNQSHSTLAPFSSPPCNYSKFSIKQLHY